MTTTGTMSAGLVLLLVASACLAAQDAPPIETADVQKKCPVMVGNPIDPNVFVVYRGKKVYFCCASCKEAFEAHPEKYLAKLPQFSASAATAAQVGSAPTQGADETPRSSEESPEFPLGELIVPLGIAAFVTVAAAVLTGVFRKLRYRLMIKLHMALGIIALIIAACHGMIVLLGI